MRVLLTAEMCNPELTSEPLVGYYACRSIVDQVEKAVVVTAIRNKEAISRHGMGGAEVVYIDHDHLHTFEASIEQMHQMMEDAAHQP